VTPLHNRISQKELKQKLLEETEPRTTISFYRYFPIAEPETFRNDLYLAFSALQVFGRIYLAQEGINAQVSVPAARLSGFREYLESVEALRGIRLNTAFSDNGKSFWVLKIKVRSKIVADGIRDDRFSMENKGSYVDAESFNELSKNPETVVVDMRNHYEYEVGHFENALQIPSDTFREQLPMAADLLKEHKEKPVIMYCTGGIRCEKASAYLLHRGFRKVYHLEGGIIHYANTVKEKGLENKFRGKNFVFDDRLGEPITGEVIAHCHQCGKPADTHTNCRNSGCHLLFIQCGDCASAYSGCCSIECQEMINRPEEEQKQLRKGKKHDQQIFNKSRRRNVNTKADPGSVKPTIPGRTT
jgi:UPF0176 protein